jgi:hypothetical protein
MEECASFNELPSFPCALYRSWRGSSVLVDDHTARPVRPRRRARRMVLRVPAGHQDRPGQQHRAGLGHRARRRRRDVATNLPEAGPPPPDLLADKGFNGKAFAVSQAARGTGVLVPPPKRQRRGMPPALRKIIAEWRNRVEATLGEITDPMELAATAPTASGVCSPVPPRPLPPTACCASASLISPRHRSTHIMRLRTSTVAR